jgi:transcriptional regulator with XRE-family HTH domain
VPLTVTSKVSNLRGGMNRRAFKRRRTELGYTQAALAKQLGVHPMTVSKWETGAQPIPEPVARLLAHVASRKTEVSKRKR